MMRLLWLGRRFWRLLLLDFPKRFFFFCMVGIGRRVIVIKICWNSIIIEWSCQSSLRGLFLCYRSLKLPINTLLLYQ
jgi:hypothetical protein